VLVELSVMEQRYRAVLQVEAGVPVTEVADACGVSRQAVHRWLRWYRDEGLSGLVDDSHRPHEHPWQIDPAVEAAICEMRRDHPRWGKRRLAFELGRQGCPGPIPSQSTIYRVLVRHNFIQPTQRGRPRDSYQRWERPEPMQLWQMDIVDGDHLVHGRDTRIITGVDDHSRYCVICAVVPHATGRAVCLALLAAFGRYGIPDELLTDNGKQFTARFNPAGGEAMFDRICRENGITHHLTKPRTPTTTGKIERFHQSLQNDWLTDCPGFASVAEAQAALDAYVVEYDTNRPHQSLDMDFPVDRFKARPIDELGLRLPAELGGRSDLVESQVPAVPSPRAASDAPLVVAANGIDPVNLAVQIDRVVPASGNLGVCGHQFWLGPGLGGVAIQLWIDITVVHILRDQVRLKTIPSRFTPAQLRQLLADGAAIAGPPPLPAQRACGTVRGRPAHYCQRLGGPGRTPTPGRLPPRRTACHRPHRRANPADPRPGPHPAPNPAQPARPRRPAPRA
jgi:transposase InsO family protein